MRSWALVVSLGPVDAFITSGRRSRDLWWGSTWVSVCTAAVARALQEEARGLGCEATLIVPTERRLRSIEEHAGRNDAAYGGRVSNFVEAVVAAPDVGTVQQLARACEGAARSFLASQLRQAVAAVGRQAKVRASLDQVLDRGAFEAQVAAIEEGDFLEIFAAWAPCGERGDVAAIERAWRLLEGRKAARLFNVPAWTRPGRAKSDLDPGRDTVLWTANTRDRAVRGAQASRRHLARRVLGVGPDEELDALGIARRLAVFVPSPSLGRLPFAPLTRVALDPWLHSARRQPKAAAALAAVRAILDRDDVQENPLIFTWCSPARDPERPFEPRAGRLENSLFPYDAGLLMEGALPALEKELRVLSQRISLGREETAARQLREAGQHLRSLAGPVARLHAELGPPSPYLALLFVDGDGIGALLRSEEDRERKQALVQALDQYADGAEEIIREHHGCAFYVGGDDLAAYLPLDRVLAATTALARRFAEAGSRWESGEAFSLSAGIVVAHAKADLRALRRRARRVLASAKEARRAAIDSGTVQSGTVQPGEGFLSICELPRSGQERVATGPLRRLSGDLAEWQGWFAGGQLSQKSSVFLRDLASRFGDPAADDGGGLGLELARYRLRAQARRSPKKAGPRLEERLGEDQLASWSDAESLAAELTIALRLQRMASLRPEEEVDVNGR